MKEKTINRKMIYKGRRIDLIRSEVMINGRKSVREIIVHPGSAVMIPVLDVKKKTIILLRQYRYAAGQRMIEFPAGTRDKGESAYKCALREMREETGYAAG
jgi:ADP-ribose pyrophosphatase